MEEINSHEELPLQPKRKPETEPLDCPKKSLKLESSGNQNQILEHSDANASTGQLKEVQLDAAGPGGSEYDEHCASGDEDAADKSNGEAMADRKGKGILRDDKGKGKLIEEEEEDDDDDDDDDDDSDGYSSGGGSGLEDGGDSDLSDDPLAEVDLDNILPSRTRRRQVQPGVYIANDLGNDDDSDDSDA